MTRIVLDGVDGAGKTTVAQVLKQRTSGIVIKDSPREFLGQLRPFIERNAEKHQGMYFAYHFAATIYADLKARHYLKNNPGGTVIFDRSLYSVLAVQLALDELFNGGKNRVLVMKIASKTIGKITAADKAVLLDVDEEDRLIRLSRRGDKEALSDLRLQFTGILRHSFDKLIQVHASDSILKINTSHRTPEGTADAISGWQAGRVAKSIIEEVPRQTELKVYRTFGSVSEASAPVFLLWAHTKPKPIYLDFLVTSKQLFNKLPTVLIDDMAPRLIENRSYEEQHKITAIFKEFFNRYGCTSVVLSEIFDQDEFAKTTEKIKSSRLIHALPKASLRELESGNSVNQLIHFKSNIYALKAGLRYGNVILAGKRDIGIFFAFYEVYKKMKLEAPLGAVFCNLE